MATGAQDQSTTGGSGAKVLFSNIKEDAKQGGAQRAALPYTHTLQPRPPSCVMILHINISEIQQFLIASGLWDLTLPARL